MNDVSLTSPPVLLSLPCWPATSLTKANECVKVNPSHPLPTFSGKQPQPPGGALVFSHRLLQASGIRCERSGPSVNGHVA
jgi:hypothetical protein